MSRSSSRGPQRPGVRVAVQESEAAGAPSSHAAADVEAPESNEPPARQGVALLRIALLLKQPDGPGIEEAISRVAARMALNEAELRSWIAANTGLLRASAPERHLRLQHPMD